MSRDRERQAIAAGLHHLTLDTGDLRWSPRGEVADNLIPIVAAHIAGARRRGPDPIPGQPGYTARAMASGDVLALTARGPGAVPIMRMVVAPSRGVAVVSHWALTAERADLVPSLTPDAPVCLVWLLPGISGVIQAAHWLGDYERSIAWAWLRGRQ